MLQIVSNDDASSEILFEMFDIPEQRVPECLQ